MSETQATELKTYLPPATLVANAERMGIAIWLLPDLYQAKLSRGRTTKLGDSSAIVYQPTPLSRLDESVNFDFNSGDLTMELTTTVQNARLGESLEYQISESAVARKTDRGAP